VKKSMLLVVIVSLYSSIAFSGFRLISKHTLESGSSIETLCVEGYVIYREGNFAFQIMGSEGKPLKCQGSVNKLIED
jgi:hypothetical protein